MSSQFPFLPDEEHLKSVILDIEDKAKAGAIPPTDTSSALAEEISTSPAYRNAWSLFYNDKQYGGPFLEKLKLIPSVKEADPTWIDDIGLSNNASDINRGAYNKAMSEIQNLVNSYYEFINSLPSTQNSQFRSIGVNSAITGQGLQGSSLSFSPSDSSSLNQLRSANPLDVVSLVSGLIGTAVSAASGSIGGITSGIMSIYKNVNDVAIARQNLDIVSRGQQVSEMSGLSGIVTSLANAGFDMTTGDFSTVEGVRSFLDQVNSDPKMLEIANNTLASAGKSVVTSQPWKSAAYLSDSDKNPVLDGIYKSRRSSPSQSYDEFFSSIAAFEADIMYLETMRNRSSALYDADVANKLASTEGASDAAAQAVIAENLKESSQDTYDELVNSVKYEYLSTWLDEYKQTKDPAQKFMILQTIYDLGLIDMVDYDLIEKTGSPILANVLKHAPDKVLDVAGMFIPAGKASKVAKAIGRRTVSKTSGPKGTTTTETISKDIYE